MHRTQIALWDHASTIARLTFKATLHCQNGILNCVEENHAKQVVVNVHTVEVIVPSHREDEGSGDVRCDTTRDLVLAGLEHRQA